MLDLVDYKNKYFTYITGFTNFKWSLHSSIIEFTTSWFGSTNCIPPVPISKHPTGKLIKLKVIIFIVKFPQACKVLNWWWPILCTCRHPVMVRGGYIGIQSGGIFQAGNLFVYKVFSFICTFMLISHVLESISQSAHTTK